MVPGGAAVVAAAADVETAVDSVCVSVVFCAVHLYIIVCFPSPAPSSHSQKRLSSVLLL